ncbi:unannotated protein [freshwater metagenome]|uniref:Unannotated protein n=1 Tax=freshwater metagenome TaxID=449393 RepID=A0A6J7VI47_9ZZZZ
MGMITQMAMPPRQLCVVAFDMGTDSAAPIVANVASTTVYTGMIFVRLDPKSRLMTTGTKTLSAAMARLASTVPRKSAVESKMARKESATTSVPMKKRMALSVGLRRANFEIPIGAATPKQISGIEVSAANWLRERWRSLRMALICGGTEVKAERWEAATTMSATTSRPLFTLRSLPAAEGPE